MNPDEFRAGSKVMGKWSDRARPGELSFEEHFALKAQKSLSLYWYTNTDSKYPIWLQLIGLWIKRYVFRKDLP